MRAVRFHEHGGPGVLRYEEAPDPGAGDLGPKHARLARGGRPVTCGATTGPQAAVDLRFLFGRQLSLLGSYMGRRGELLDALPFFLSGRLRPAIDRVYPLGEAAAAQERLEAAGQFGKIVLEIE